MKSGCSESWPTAVCSADAAPTVSAHQWSRPSCQSTSCPVALDHHDVLHGVPGPGQGVVDRGLQGAGLAAAVGAVGGDHELGLGVVDPGPQGVGGEAAEHHGVDRADPGAGQQRDHGLRNHGQVDGHPVALGHAEGLEGVRGLLHLLGQLGVGVGAGVPGFALEVDGHPVPEAVLDVAVQRVVGGVDLPADEPLRERRVGPVQRLGEVLGPGPAAPGPAWPRTRAVGVGLGVHVGADHRVRRELGRRRETCGSRASRFSKASPLAEPAVAVEPGVSWDMVNLIIHRSLLRGRTRPLPRRAAMRDVGRRQIADSAAKSCSGIKTNAWVRPTCAPSQSAP